MFDQQDQLAGLAAQLQSMATRMQVLSDAAYTQQTEDAGENISDFSNRLSHLEDDMQRMQTVLRDLQDASVTDRVMLSAVYKDLMARAAE
jgi:hypothetical protein